MINEFFNFAKRVKAKNPQLANSFLWSKVIRPYWWAFKYRRIYANFHRKNKIFYSQNRNRVDRITSWFADEESKKTYLKMIAFRQSGKRKDHITHGDDTQYFINDFFRYGKNEVLIDCGAYTGDTIDKFIALPLEYDQIIGFEPDPENFSIFKNKYADNSKVLAINAGVYDKDGDLYFDAKGTGMSQVSNGGGGGVICLLKFEP